MKKILTGVDCSETAAAAVQSADELAAAFGAWLHLVAAFVTFRRDEVPDGIAGEKIVVTNDGDATRTAHDAEVLLRRRHSGPVVTSAPADGTPSEALLRAAMDLGADLHVVGNKHIQGPGRILGSIARDVAAAATCDVCVERTHSRDATESQQRQTTVGGLDSSNHPFTVCRTHALRDSQRDHPIEISHHREDPSTP